MTLTYFMARSTLVVHANFLKCHLKGKTCRKWANGQIIYDLEKEIDPKGYSDTAMGLYTCILYTCMAVYMFTAYMYMIITVKQVYTGMAVYMFTAYMYMIIIVKQGHWYISRISGERLHDHGCYYLYRHCTCAFLLSFFLSHSVTKIKLYHFAAM